MLKTLKRLTLAAAGVLAEGEGSAEQVRVEFAKLERYLVDLDTGDYRRIELDDRFDQRKATKEPAQSIALTSAQDVAGLKRRALQADIDVLRGADGRTERFVLPASAHFDALFKQRYLPGNGERIDKALNGDLIA